MKEKLFFLASVFIGIFESTAQYRTVTLDEVLEMSRSQSPRYKLAETQKEISYNQFQVFKSDFRPQVLLYGNAPVYNKEYYGVRQPDGTIKFQSISQNNATVGVGLSQLIGLTGGEISLNTDLTRFDDFKANTKQYNATPVYLRLSQPVFAFNELKWRKRIEPLRYEESKRNFVFEMEKIAGETVNLYFDLLDAQSDMQIATFNLKNIQTNYEIEKKRVALGTTTEDKLLQLELSVLSNQQQLESAKYDFEIAQLNLNTFIGSKGLLHIQPVIPADVVSFSVNLQKAIEYARKYRPDFIAFERKKHEAQMNVAEAKAATQEINIIASYGLNNTGALLGSVYNNLNDQQRFNIGFNIPIVDWGRRKARYNTAKSLEKLAIFNNELDESTLIQEITTIVANLELLKQNIVLAKKTDSVAERRYLIANTLYQSGELTITDVGLAQMAKDEARRNFVNSLRQFWTNFYLLRRLTLYDFSKDEALLGASPVR